jgi:hypothetical protein
MEVVLSRDNQLKNQGNKALISCNEKLVVKLDWEMKRHLDLCVFYETTQGEIGGIFPVEYIAKENSLGDINSYPFIQLGHWEGSNWGGMEIFRVARMDLIKTLYIVLISDEIFSKDRKEVDYIMYSAILEVQSDDGYQAAVYAAPYRKGEILLLSIINKVEGNNYTISNSSLTYTVEEANRNIPGFFDFCTKV